MKRGILLIIILAIAGFLAYRFIFKKEDNDRPKNEPMQVSGTDQLTVNTAEALKSYYSLKDAFVQSDTSNIHESASDLIDKMNNIPIKEVKADTALIDLAETLRKNINSETNKILTTTGIEDKRKSFQIVSDNLYDLLRTTGYSGSKVYQQYCPMAFDNMGAAWLSNDTEIFNPYFGDKMLHCGEVRDSLRTGE